ncbi:diacylglycerol kinase family protein [Bacteroidales bacterium OttesenSCG-928-I14]|nr:diacylglycerol kinase family protein [Bacteroidales bacterium OttesenSCG-928-I14]
MEENKRPYSPNPFKHAWEGIKILLTKERNFKIHVTIIVLVIIAGFFFNIKPLEWVAVLILFGLVLGMEALNTSIELICDHIHKDYHPNIKKIKDIAAAAVFICAIISVIVGTIIFLPYLLNLVEWCK